MAQLIIKSTERKPVFPSTDFSSAHLWGDVIDIVADHLDTDHYVPVPFMVISAPGEKVDFDWLLAPLTEQVSEIGSEGEDLGPKPVLRKRYTISIDNLPASQRLELCSTGKTSLSTYLLESVVECR